MDSDHAVPGHNPGVFAVFESGEHVHCNPPDNIAIISIGTDTILPAPSFEVRKNLKYSMAEFHLYQSCLH